MADEINWGLIENGLDFLYSAVENIQERDDSDRSLKYAILHLNDAIELLLKRSLERLHWSLVLENIDKTSLAKIRSGDFTSVAGEDLTDRLEKLGLVTFEASQKEFLKRLRLLRNRIQHFGFKISKEQAIAVVAEGLHFCLDMAQKPLGNDWLSEDRIKIIQTELVGFDEFVTFRVKAIQQQADCIMVSCPRCRQRTLVADGIAHCRYCDYEDGGAFAAQDWLLEFGSRDGGSDDPSYCEECCEVAMVRISAYWEHESEMCPVDCFCFSCGDCGNIPQQYISCASCGQLARPVAEDIDECCNCLRQKGLRDRD